MDFLQIDLYSTNLINSFVISSCYFVDSLRFSMYTIMSFLPKNSFILFFPIFIPLFLFLALLQWPGPLAQC